ncbi:MAG: S-methyl-5-thioribose-1-phosphate isomerase [Pseudohongiellaceae bacterium]
MELNGKTLYSIVWQEDSATVRIIDQTGLPHRLEYCELESLEAACEAIEQMRVRGAPLIGITAAFGLYFALRRGAVSMDLACQQLLSTRPTAVNLQWALQRLKTALLDVSADRQADTALRCARQLLAEDADACERIGEHGLSLLQALHDRHQRTLNVLTHCNAGWLATADWGTALAPVYKAHAAGIPVHVWVDETRPRLQGASLTAWELEQAGVPCTVITDNAGGHLMQQGEVDICLVGSDRTAANGDVCNKIGTYLKALAARDNAVPFYVALPVSSIDFSLREGVGTIPIEERNADEVRWVQGMNTEGVLTAVRVTPPGTGAGNPGFDVTPARLISGLITEQGTVDASARGVAELAAP